MSRRPATYHDRTTEAGVILKTRRVPTGDVETAKYLVSKFVRHERSGIVHGSFCASLEGVPLDRVTAVNLNALPADSRLCTHCLQPRPRARRRPPKPVTCGTRLVALKRFRYDRRDIEAGAEFKAVSAKDAEVLVLAKLARPPSPTVAPGP